MSQQSLGQRLRARRLERGFSLREVAVGAMHHTYLHEIENDQRNPSADKLAHLARVLEISEEEMAAWAGRLSDDLKAMLHIPAVQTIVRFFAKHDGAADALVSIASIVVNGLAAREVFELEREHAEATKPKRKRK